MVYLKDQVINTMTGRGSTLTFCRSLTSSNRESTLRFITNIGYIILAQISLFVSTTVARVYEKGKSPIHSSIKATCQGGFKEKMLHHNCFSRRSVLRKILCSNSLKRN